MKSFTPKSVSQLNLPASQPATSIQMKPFLPLADRSHKTIYQFREAIAFA